MLKNNIKKYYCVPWVNLLSSAVIGAVSKLSFGPISALEPRPSNPRNTFSVPLDLKLDSALNLNQNHNLKTAPKSWAEGAIFEWTL